MASFVPWDGTGASPNLKVNFQKEISSIMHGLGDNPNPNAATVLLVENILLQQLCCMLQEAYNNSLLRGSKLIHNVDVIFLMRKNKLKLKRLQEYQMKLEASETYATGINSEDNKDPVAKTKRTHIEVIKELDETDEISNIEFDALIHKRKVRAAHMSEALSKEKYAAYHKARCVSFKSGYVQGWARNYSKLEMWINVNKEYKISNQAMEVLGFLACETIGELIDAVYLIRQDAKRRHGDPMSKFEGGNFCNPVSIGNAVYIKSGLEGVPAITVAEVREVLRRYFPPRVGMNGLFARNINMDLHTKYIAF